MTKVNPASVNATLTRVVKDGLVTGEEAGKIAPALIKDLLKSENAQETLKLAAQNLRKFLEPFRANDSQEENGVRLARDTRYSLTDLAGVLEEAAENMERMKGGVFAFAMGLHLEDSKLTVQEAKQLDGVAKQLLEGAADPAAAARQMRTTLLELENMFAQSAAFGMGPLRDEVLTAGASRSLAKINALLGSAIAKGLEGTAASETINPDGEFAKQMAEILATPGWERRIMLETLPRLVDHEVAMFDSTGLAGPAKLRMDQQAEARAKALLEYTSGLGGDDVEDVKNALYRIVTGRFLPESMMPEFFSQLTSLGVDELEGGIKSFEERIKNLAEGQSFSVKNERKGLEEGIALIKQELESRAVASGLSTIGDDATKAAVLDFLKADDDIASVLADGGRLDEGSVKMFTWAEAREAIKDDHAAGANLDVVLQNMAKAGNMLSRDAKESFAFARVTLHLPGEDPFPLTVALKKGDDGFAPHVRADGGIPL